MCKFLSSIFNKPKTGETKTAEVVVEPALPQESHQAKEEIEETDEHEENSAEPVFSTPSYSGTDFVILLDNGHASSTPGKRSPLYEDGSRLFEYEFNRAVVKRIAERLDTLGIKYHILVPELDYDVPLTTRANRANKYCSEYGTAKCLFISVHANALGKGENWTCKEAAAGGWSVYTTKGVTKSDAYAKVFYDVADEMLPKYGFKCRDGKHHGETSNEGPDYEENFTVIYKTWCPAILTENLFYTNRKECDWLRSEEGRDVIADLHVEAIKRIIDNL